MRISKALLISAFITAVVLVIAASAVSISVAKRGETAREAEYQQLIDQANQQMEQANAQLLQMQSQLSQAQPTTQMAAAAEAAPSGATLSGDQAADIARKAVEKGQSMQKAPELVDFQGTPAYEVAFDNGSVYVDAASGEVLFNGTVPQKIDDQTAAKVASDYLGDKNVLSVDTVMFRGQQLFRVIFKSGTMVYLDETGQITYINKGMLAIADDSGGGDDGGGGGSIKVVHHEDDDQHEDHDDD